MFSTGEKDRVLFFYGCSHMVSQSVGSRLSIVFGRRFVNKAHTNRKIILINVIILAGLDAKEVSN